MSGYSFKKSERLKSRKIIAGLFGSSFSFGRAPLRILWKVEKKSDEEVPCKLVIAVPKRRIKKAVQRNRIKRLIKEAYRMNKSEVCSFFNEKGLTCHLGILYISNEMPTFGTINAQLKKLIENIPNEYEKHFK